MSWHVVYTKPKQELRAQENLTNQRFETFLPMISIEKIRQGAIARVTEPLFSRYLFVQLKLDSDAWGCIRSTVGVCTILTSGGGPTAVPEGLVEALMETQAALKNAGVQKDGLQRLLQAGHEVLFTQGPLKGMRGIFQQHDGEARAMVLIEIMSRPQKVTTDVACLIPAPV